MSDQIPGMPGGLAAGSYVAGYRLEERIGHGGMAAVFRAYDSRLDRLVALKVMAPSLAEDEAFRQRFIRESRAAAAVDDPHIIPVYAAGESDGVLYLAMRLVRGGDVLSLVDRIGPLPAGRAAEIISQVASALDAAHTRGLVHRDVKPANMLLEASPAADRPDHVYLSDFGLTKTSLALSGLTATGQFLGTLDYVAPEQIESRQVDGRTDQYSLACAAYELLSGEPPFRRADSISVMYAQLNDPPPTLRPRRSDLPAGVDAVLGRALSKSSGDRYPTCREFASALRQALQRGAGRPAPHPATELAVPPAPVPPRQEQPAGPARTAAATGPASRPEDTAAGSAPPGVTAPVRIGGDDTGLPGTRPWWRSPLPVAGICAVVLLAGGAYALTGHHHPPAAPRTLGATHHTQVKSLSLPACTTRTAPAPTLSGVMSATVATGGSPFGIAITQDGKYSLVSTGNAVDVLSNTTGLAPTLVRSVYASHATKMVTLTPGGKYALAAGGSGAAVLNVAEAVQGGPAPVAGYLTSPSGSGAFQALVSADGKFAFVTLQGSNKMAVFNLEAALTQNFPATDFVGYVPLGDEPVGLTSDGSWLYVMNLGGTMSIVDEHTAETQPAKAVIKTVMSGCGSARAMLSADGSVLWVTARDSDELLGFSTSRLHTDPQHALIARVMVGEAPLGETFADNGRRIVLADSNLNGVQSAVASIAVVDTTKALAGQPALLGYIQTGAVPRTVVVEPGGSTLLVSDEHAGQLQALRVADLP